MLRGGKLSPFACGRKSQAESHRRETGGTNISVRAATDLAFKRSLFGEDRRFPMKDYTIWKGAKKETQEKCLSLQARSRRIRTTRGQGNARSRIVFWDVCTVLGSFFGP